MIAIHNIAIPVPEGDEFITPDIEKATEYYPQYVAHCIGKGIAPFSRRGYLLEVCKELAKTGIVRDGKERTKDDIMKRVMEHFGLSWLQRWFDEETW
jgi:hypothetical protein